MFSVNNRSVMLKACLHQIIHYLTNRTVEPGHTGSAREGKRCSQHLTAAYDHIDIVATKCSVDGVVEIMKDVHFTGASISTAARLA